MVRGREWEGGKVRGLREEPPRQLTPPHTPPQPRCLTRAKSFEAQVLAGTDISERV